MKCYTHNQVDAIGICKHCYKALCVDCCSDLNNGLACKDKHEAQVTHLNQLIENNKKAYASQPKATLLANLPTLILGILFIMFGYRENITFLFVMGFVMVIFTIINLIYNRRYFKKVITNYDNK